MSGLVMLVAAGLAAVPVSPIERGRLAAVEKWGEIPCEGVVKIVRRKLPGLVAGEAFYRTDQEGARRWDCEVTVDVEQVRGELRCAVAMHEFRHLFGVGHSPNPRSVMHSPLSMIPRACRRWR
jgi:hypothetical protein